MSQIGFLVDFCFFFFFFLDRGQLGFKWLSGENRFCICLLSPFPVALQFLSVVTNKDGVPVQFEKPLNGRCACFLCLGSCLCTCLENSCLWDGGLIYLLTGGSSVLCPGKASDGLWGRRFAGHLHLLSLLPLVPYKLCAWVPPSIRETEMLPRFECAPQCYSNSGKRHHVCFEIEEFAKNHTWNAFSKCLWDMQVLVV